MSNHPIEVAIAIAVSGLIAVIALLLFPQPTLEFPAARPRPSMKLSRAELLALAQQHKIKDSKWRARATKADFVRALQQEVQS